ncbi:Uncharacterized protein APZ42_025054 [Daphnia magna]|uniref:Uncharacterized protein n=1 Tax=Daphnia magna TaxID=35525 RepID=A0A164TID4_9CRUS|nr:Uncharacterized protein APZ42_025054 [Daphnia magna]
MMGDPPATVNAFLAELRRLEAISVSPFDSSKAMFDAGPPPSSTNNNRSLSQIVEGLTTQEPEMKYSVTTVTHLDTLHVIALIKIPASQEQQQTRKTAKPPHRGRSGNKRAQSPQTYQPGADRSTPCTSWACVDWMGKSNVGVRLSIQYHCQMEAVIFPEISTNNSSNNIDENLTKEEVDAGNGVPSSNHPLADLATQTISKTAMVERAHSACPDGEWIVPHCLVNIEGKYVRVPVTDLSKKPLLLKKGQKLTRISPWGLEEATNNIDEVCGTLREEDITENRTLSISGVLDKYAGCFSNKGKIGIDVIHAHRINTGDARPISARPRRVSTYERQIIAEQVKSMLSKGIIEPSIGYLKIIPLNIKI